MGAGPWFYIKGWHGQYLCVKFLLYEIGLGEHAMNGV